VSEAGQTSGSFCAVHVDAVVDVHVFVCGAALTAAAAVTAATAAVALAAAASRWMARKTEGGGKGGRGKHPARCTGVIDACVDTGAL
jgi:hypothetical protein